MEIYTICVFQTDSLRKKQNNEQMNEKTKKEMKKATESTIFRYALCVCSMEEKDYQKRNIQMVVNETNALNTKILKLKQKIFDVGLCEL